MNEGKVKSFELDKMEWQEFLDEHMQHNFFDKRMIGAEEEGIVVNFSRYPKGFYKDLHRHNCSHGIYVISGKLKTDEGIYGPGSFVWHSEGSVARHGATDEEECVFLFVTNKPFDIIYVPEDESR